MSRYGDNKTNRLKEDIFDDLKFRYEESGLTSHEFIQLLVQVIADLIEEIFWETDNLKG